MNRKNKLITVLVILLINLISVTVLAIHFPDPLREIMPLEEWKSMLSEHCYQLQRVNKLVISAEAAKSPFNTEFAKQTPDELKKKILAKFIHPAESWCEDAKCDEKTRKPILFNVLSQPILRNAAYAFYKTFYQDDFTMFHHKTQKLLIEMLDDHIDYLQTYNHAQEVTYLENLKQQKYTSPCDFPDEKKFSIWCERGKETGTNEWRFQLFGPDGQYHPEREGFAWCFRQINANRISQPDLLAFLQKVKEDAVLIKKKSQPIKLQAFYEKNLSKLKTELTLKGIEKRINKRDTAFVDFVNKTPTRISTLLDMLKIRDPLYKLFFEEEEETEPPE